MKKFLHNGKDRTVRLVLSLLPIIVLPTLLSAQGPAIPGLPAGGVSVTGLQGPVPSSGPSGPTYSTFTVSSPATGPISVTGNPYNAWCFNPFGSILGIPETYTAYSSYDPSFLALSGAGSATGWMEVNWVINHPHGATNEVNPTPMDIQYVIWNLLDPGYYTFPSGDTAGPQLLNDAQSPAAQRFVPGPGQLLAIALYIGGISPTDRPTTPQDIFIPYPVPCSPGQPGLKITKSANVQTAKCTNQVTYTYTVTNTGNVTLTNIVVTEDNATPAYTGDDFTVGTIASLAPGKSASLTATIYLPVTETAVDANGNVTNHTLIKQVLPNGNIQVTLLEDTNLVDNSYGFSASPDWTNGNALWNHIGNDSAEFQFTDGQGNVVLDFAADYISLSNNAPLGLATAGLNGAGQLYSGNASNIVSIDTTLSDNLNRPTSDWGFVFNAPPPGYSNNWNFQCGYTVVIKPSCFGRNGFGDCKIKTIQHSNCKLGNNYQCNPTPVCSKVIDTATATVNYNGTTLTATGQATVTETAANGQCTTPPPPSKCQQQKQQQNCQPQNWWNNCGKQWQQSGQWWH